MMFDWLRAAARRVPDRRRFERYDVEDTLDIEADGCRFQATMSNVSAGGVLVTPALPLPVEAGATLRHRRSGLAVDGVVVGHDGGATRFRLTSENALVIVAAWLRTGHEARVGSGDDGS